MGSHASQHPNAQASLVSTFITRVMGAMDAVAFIQRNLKGIQQGCVKNSLAVWSKRWHIIEIVFWDLLGPLQITSAD